MQRMLPEHLLCAGAGLRQWVAGGPALWPHTRPGRSISSSAAVRKQGRREGRSTGWGWRPLFWRSGVFGGGRPEGDQKGEIQESRVPARGPHAERSRGPAVEGAPGPEGPKEDAQRDWRSGGRGPSVSVGRKGAPGGEASPLRSVRVPAAFPQRPCRVHPVLSVSGAKQVGASKSKWGSQVARAFGIQFLRRTKSLVW
uniref:Uncharacterized protein n=1 Tax=Molossus molossus TaxID=27622 RepID=A0A7J8C960_MOLMO|nr:hypothetical protein HJG59_009999 [Molossus molossus]